jgi:hypothetical protein
MITILQGMIILIQVSRPKLTGKNETIFISSPIKNSPIPPLQAYFYLITAGPSQAFLCRYVKVARGIPASFYTPCNFAGGMPGGFYSLCNFTGGMSGSFYSPCNFTRAIPQNFYRPCKLTKGIGG